MSRYLPSPYSREYEDLREYFNDYPSIILRIKDVASSRGCKGEYIVEELQVSLIRVVRANLEPATP